MPQPSLRSYHQRLAPVSNGIDFLSYIVRRDYLLVRRRVVHHLKMKLRDYEKQLVQNRGRVRCYRFDEVCLDRLAATLSSYLGHFKLAHCWKLWSSIWRRFGFLSRYFEFDAQHWKLMRKYPVPKGMRRVKQQYRYFRWRFPDAVLFFQVGRFMECYDIGEPRWSKSLGLKHMGWNRRGARCGFPVSQTAKQLQISLSRGMSVMLIREQKTVWNRIQARIPHWRYEPVAVFGC